MPRPRHHPLLGNLMQWLGPEQGRTVLQRLLAYAHECGPLARVPLGPTSIVSVGDIDIASELLTNEDANYKGWTYILTRTVLDNVLLLNGDAWAHGRRTYRAALRSVEVLPSADLCAAAHLDLEHEWMVRQPGPRDLDLGAFASGLVGDTIGHFVARTRIDADLDPDRARIQHELAAVGMDLQCQPWAYFSPRRWTSLRASVRRMQAHFRGVVQQRRRHPAQGTVPDVLDGVLALARDGAHDDDDDRIADTLINIFFTAHDVLASSTGWCLWLLANHPEVQDRLRAELRALGPGAPASAVIEAPYLDRVIKESLRLYPGYALFGRNPQRPTTLAGYRVPRSALIIVSPWVLHRLPQYWPRPEVFDPDRWADTTPGPPPPHPEGGYMPFGAGRRGCLASRLAYPTMQLLVARVIERLTLRGRPGHVPRLRYGGTSYSENGLPCTVGPA